MKKATLWFGLLASVYRFSLAQVTFPVNGIADPRTRSYAFIHATIVKKVGDTLRDATLLIKRGKIEAIGQHLAAPADAVVVDCSGKYIFPSFIDLYSSYGLPQPKQAEAISRRNRGPQFISSKKGAYGWNEAIHPEIDAGELFDADDKVAERYRKAGFGVVLTASQDGISRGTGALVSVASPDDVRDNLLILKKRASAHYSFDKGSSTQDYPSSLMGAIALLRQTYYDARWYASRPPEEGTNLSLEAWNATQSLPQIFAVSNKWDALRAAAIGKEFQVSYLIKAGGDEYQRIDEIKATGCNFILPLHFPDPYDVSDPAQVRFLSLAAMKHWELAPTQPATFERANIPFCFTLDGLNDPTDWLKQLRKAFHYGLSQAAALNALTLNPAKFLGVDDQLGSLEPGKWANFLICSGPVFDEQTIWYQHWIQGYPYVLESRGWTDIRGNYVVDLSDGNKLQWSIKGKRVAPTLQVIRDGDTLSGNINWPAFPVGTQQQLIRMSFPVAPQRPSPGKKSSADSTAQILMSGWIHGDTIMGTALMPSGKELNWIAYRTAPYTGQPDTADKTQKYFPRPGPIYYPFQAFGYEHIPQQPEAILIKNATVWTNESAGILPQTDVLIRKGKIAAIGKNLTDKNAVIIDATGMHLTPGIIDEHSHIAITGGVNEGTQSVTSEVRISDVINPEDVNIYRQLAGGVTASHLLHGSANTIGGQTQLIKMRWGHNAEQLKFQGWDPFIKFALGENVKQSNWGDDQHERFPQTRMGVEQTIVDAFTRAQDYDKLPPGKRKDLELEALVEILNHQRFITCHSYVQSEITMLMRVAEQFGFRINTFTHILEGYKVADKMKVHGAGASTFSDWWAYKMEVVDAIPYNATILDKMGVITAINSDDAEMGRRLNQESAKSIKYGNLSEEEALKLCTLYPARLLHVDRWVGSIKPGKDADLVLWNNDPLSIYARVEKTFVDGTIYFDRVTDSLMQVRNQQERNRIIQEMLQARAHGEKTQPIRLFTRFVETEDADLEISDEPYLRAVRGEIE
ncbi:MAG: amidohydrolase family protein [Thermoflavifilum sp.]|nr:amidohydrolase family protein [Thermoflavifilum sp.]